MSVHVEGASVKASAHLAAQWETEIRVGMSVNQLPDVQ